MLPLVALIAAALTGPPMAEPQPRDPVPWQVLGVSADQRTLEIGYITTGCPGADVHVVETKREIKIDVASVPPERDVVCPTWVRVLHTRHRLRARVAGRRISGPKRGIGTLDISVGPRGTDPVEVPRVIGLHGRDAQRALAATRLRARFPRGAEGAVRSQSPRPGKSVRVRSTVRLMTRR
jgi:hypothetical protein